MLGKMTGVALLQEDNTVEEGKTEKKADKDFVFAAEMFNANDMFVLQSIIDTASNGALQEKNISKTASVKFMITLQDQKELRTLGYTQEQIDKIKPQDASDIIQKRIKSIALETL